MRAITGAAHGARAMVKGHYRLIDQPADSAVTVDNILAPHREQTLRRMQAHDTVLCIQDGTRLNFTRRGQTQGLGAIGSNQTGAVARGLELHTTLAANPDGVALGVLRAAFDAPASPNPAAEGEPPPKAARSASRSVGSFVVRLHGIGHSRLPSGPHVRNDATDALTTGLRSHPAALPGPTTRSPQSARRAAFARLRSSSVLPARLASAACAQTPENEQLGGIRHGQVAPPSISPFPRGGEAAPAD